MMTRVLKNIFVCFLALYLISTGYTRFKNYGRFSLSLTMIYLLPFDAFPLKYLRMEGKERVFMQIGVLSKASIVELLETNADQFPNCYEGTTLKPPSFELDKDYVVLRFKNNYCSSYWGNIKCYFSCFPHATAERIALPSQMPTYYNFILPYPEFLEKNSQDPCAITLRWKNFW